VDPPPRFRRSLFGYRPAQVRAFLAEHQTPANETQEADVEALRADVRDLEAELETAQRELTERAASLWSAESAARAASERGLEAELRIAELEADLRSAEERIGVSGEEVRDAQEQVSTLTSKLDVIRSALTAEIQKVWTAELRVHEIGTELGTVRDALDRSVQETEEQRARADAAESAAATTAQSAQRHAQPWTSGELAPVFDMAERTVTRIISEARRRGDEELREVETSVASLRIQTRELEEWRDRVEPLVTPVRRSVERAQVEADRVGGLIREALEPMTSAVATLGERLVDLASAAATIDEPRAPEPEVPEAVPPPAASDAGSSETIVDVTDDEERASSAAPRPLDA
jgi:chromosome segregation ATPase